jgi:hypothetical protein
LVSFPVLGISIDSSLTNQNQTLLASSLQTAYNLGVLATLVQRLLSDLSQAVEERIQNAFDLSRISKDAFASGMLNFVPLILSQF